jgi:RHS repeat-associated protein
LPFGEEIPANTAGRRSEWGPQADTVNQKFTGKERDLETGLDYFGARYFSSAQGRFTSPDPLGGSLIDPQSLNKYSYVRNNPLTFTDPTGMYVCKDSKDCSSDQDKAFEKARLAALKSKDGNVSRAAAAYGDPTKDNGVTVQFGDPGKGRDGITVHSLGVDPNDASKIRAEETVTIRDGVSGSALNGVVGHEGSHVADAQDFAATINMNGGFDVSKNLNQYQTEFKAYMVTNSILNSLGDKKSFGQCGDGDCILGFGVSQRQAGNTINQLLANPRNGYGITPKSPGALLYPALTTPQKPQ